MKSPRLFANQWCCCCLLFTSSDLTSISRLINCCPWESISEINGAHKHNNNCHNYTPHQLQMTSREWATTTTSSTRANKQTPRVHELCSQFSLLRPRILACSLPQKLFILLAAFTLARPRFPGYVPPPNCLQLDSGSLRAAWGALEKGRETERGRQRVRGRYTVSVSVHCRICGLVRANYCIMIMFH